MDLPSNRAGFKDSDPLEKKIEKHNRNVEDTMNRAKLGAVINLTDLMIDHEKIYEEIVDSKEV